jgi:hypothetical protein
MAFEFQSTVGYCQSDNSKKTKNNPYKYINLLELVFLFINVCTNVRFPSVDRNFITRSRYSPVLGGRVSDWTRMAHNRIGAYFPRMNLSMPINMVLENAVNWSSNYLLPADIKSSNQKCCFCGPHCTRTKISVEDLKLVLSSAELYRNAKLWTLNMHPTDYINDHNDTISIVSTAYSF